MVHIRVMRISSAVYFVIIAVLLAAVIFLSWRLISGDPVQFNSTAEQGDEETFPRAETDDVNPVYKSMLAGGFPAVAAADSSSGNLLSNLWRIITGADMRDPRAILSYPMPYLKDRPELPDNAPDNAVEVSAGLPDRSKADRPENPDAAGHEDSEEGSESGVSEEIKIKIGQIQVDQKPLALEGQGPKILIYHSHTRESYGQDPNDPYKEAFSEAFRTDDAGHSVVKIGQTLAQQLTERGISVLHDQTNHEAGGYNSSYAQSLQTLQKQMKDHDSLQVFIDIHRNGYDVNSGKKADDEVVVIGGERVAKVMVVIGTGEGVMGGFNEKPKWEENAKLAIKLTNKINELYPGLAKDVYYKTGRYNQHVSTNAILIEVGSNFTTLGEAERSTKYLAEAISQIIE